MDPLVPATSKADVADMRKSNRNLKKECLAMRTRWRKPPRHWPCRTADAIRDADEVARLESMKQMATSLIAQAVAADPCRPRCTGYQRQSIAVTAQSRVMGKFRLLVVCHFLWSNSKM
jgi:hypothetical protein